MNDIAKCNGGECPIKDKCKRYTIENKGFFRGWLDNTPFTVWNNHVKCDFFIKNDKI